VRERIWGDVWELRRVLLIMGVLTAFVLLSPAQLAGEAVAARQPEGVAHGFLTLRDMGGKKLADGEMTQVVHGGRVESHLVFRFNDGSLYEDKTEFTQEGHFKLMSDHVVQKGPSFKKPSDTLVDLSKGEVTVRSKDEDGQEKAETTKLDMPADVANGLLFTILKHIKPNTIESNVSYVSTNSKPQIVKMVITLEGQRAVSNGRIHVTSNLYKLKVDIGGAKGVLAKVTGKQPADIHVWVLGGAAPAFIRWEGPLYAEGPVWRIDLASPKPSSSAR
jgi:hypothetical protein